MKAEAIIQAERLGHRLGQFNKYKDDEVYYSVFCSRCSGYLRVTAYESSGRPVQEKCQKRCSCEQSLTPADLDGQCAECRGNLLTLYPKTPAVRAKDASFIEYCRKERKDYEPGSEQLSDFFWRCVQCARRLGSGYQGDPDERGYCDACVASETAWAKRKAETIEAAGGLKAWNRKKLINKLLTPIDYAALIVFFFTVATAALGTVIWIAMGLMRLARDVIKSAGEDRVLLSIFGLSFLWVAIRWKHLNSKPPHF